MRVMINMQNNNDNIMLKSIKLTFKLTFDLLKYILKLIIQLLKYLILATCKLVKLGCLYLITKFKNI